MRQKSKSRINLRNSTRRRSNCTMDSTDNSTGRGKYYIGPQVLNKSMCQHIR